MSHKNKLLEFLQKNKLNIPTFVTTRIDTGIDHNPIWMSQIIINDNTFSGQGRSKKEAEAEASKFAMEILVEQNLRINNPIMVSKIFNFDDHSIQEYSDIYLFDGENYNINSPPKGLCLFFVAKNTTKKIVFQFQEKYSNCYVIISECVGRDAADHLLTFYAGKLSILYPDKNYYILTKDHYGEFLEKFMKNCKYVCSGI